MSTSRPEMTGKGSRTWLGLGDRPMEALEPRTLLAAPTHAVAGMWTDANSLTVVIEWGNANPATLGNGDITATANGREPIVGTMIGSPVLMPNGKHRVAYKLNAYDNAWGVTDSGTYTFSSPIGQVVSPQGDLLGNSFVTTRGLWWNIPKSRLISNTMRPTDWLVVVQYDSANGIKQSTIDATDITLTTGSHNGISVYQVINNSATRKTVVYQIKAPNGAWSHMANGSYTLAIGANAVKDNSDRSVAAHEYRRFGLWFSTPHAHVHGTSVGENFWLIPIKYTPAPGSTMNPATLLSVGVVHVTGPGGFNMDAEIEGFQSHLNGAYTVTYRINANGGSWDFPDNGSYYLNMKPNRAADSAGRFIPGYEMKRFGLWFTTPAAEVVTPTGPSGNVWDLGIRFRDDVQIDLSTININSIRILDPQGIELNKSLVSITPGGNAATQTAVFRIIALGGFDPGQYRVFLNRDGVRDSGGRIAAENLIGTFNF